MSADTIDTRTPKITPDEWKLGINRAIAAIKPPQASVMACDPRETPEPSQGQQLLAKAGIKFLSAIIADANELLANPFEDEYGNLIQTSKEVHALCCELLVSAAIDDFYHRRDVEGKMAVPAAVVSSDESGGLRIEWVRDDASVHLVIPTDVSKSYIYTEFGGACKIEAANAVILAKSLRKIT